MPHARKPLSLIILDGWGHSETSSSNAIELANTPVWDRLIAQSPNTLISTSGMAVGLPDGQMGNSEVGHMNLGAGRIVYQDFTRISKAIEDGDFYTNPALVKALKAAADSGSTAHIMGLLSPGGVHSHEEHIFAIIKMAHQLGVKKLNIHAFMDGRDTPPRSALASIEKLEAVLSQYPGYQIASLCGRYYAMDRDNRWDRVERAYNLIVAGDSEFQYACATDALNAAYARDENDEFVQPSVILNAASVPSIDDGDHLIFMNFRADRAREITRAISNPEFQDFTRKVTPTLGGFVMLTQYAADIDLPSAFPPVELQQILGEYLAESGKTQLRISETEKYAHVTFFFNGGREQPFNGEERILIPSPDVATYDLQPEMSAPELTDRLVEAITGGQFDVIICNYPNGDMVGHTGNMDAAKIAVETIDQCLARIEQATIEAGGESLITADHGNVEQMFDPNTGQPHTAHTTGPVPLLYIGGIGENEQATTAKARTFSKTAGQLSDIAPTMLAMLGLAQPAEMTGRSLFSDDK
ncbi:MAG: 2,3-bisphosphoglycerate-independent phosphoglycerate mutase [Pseudomonadales bacterium]|nr:2,3-bisphosphoglycerate-independent phosphoglycerate mutase [Pseudomonadales bacterium]